MLKADLIFANSMICNNAVKDEKQAINLAATNKAGRVKLYDHCGCFLKEFALFDGKYREVLF